MPDLPEALVADDAWLALSPMLASSAAVAFLRQHEDDLFVLTGDRLIMGEFRRLADGLDEALSPELPRPGRFRRSIDKHPLMTAVEKAAGRRRSEQAVTRYVDNYLTYLAELLREILSKRPEVMKSSAATLTVEQALSFGSVDELRLFVADQAVTSLSYAGLAEVEKYFINRLGVILFSDDAIARYLRQIVLVRNLLTHRRGVVDRRSIRAGLSATDYPLGRRVDLPDDEVRRVMAATVLGVLDLDRRVSDKFQLAQEEFAPRLGIRIDSSGANDTESP